MSSSPQFYRRPLPPGCVALASAAGRELFSSALSGGQAQGFFHVISQYSTQAEPAFCGLATLAIALNALSIDPGRSWKGVWRWYSEELLDCCAPLEKVKQSGITLDAFACLARCNGASIEVRRPPSKEVDGTAKVALRETTASPSPTAGCCHGRGSGGAAVDSTASTAAGASEADFRATVKAVTAVAEGAVLVVAYSRRVLKQTGDGHFSPIGAYDPASDSVLILDTARFKHPPHWVPLSLLYEAMRSLDPDTGKPRGYAVIRRAAAVPLLLFHFSGSVTPRAAVLGLPEASAGATSGSESSATCRAPMRDLSGSLAELLAKLQKSLAACEADGCGAEEEGEPAPEKASGCCGSESGSVPASSPPSRKAADASLRQGVRCFVNCYLSATEAHGPIVSSVLGVQGQAERRSTGDLPTVSSAATPESSSAGSGGAGAAASVTLTPHAAGATSAAAAKRNEWDYLSPEHRESVQQLLCNIEALAVYTIVCEALREAETSDSAACCSSTQPASLLRAVSPPAERAAPHSSSVAAGAGTADVPTVRISHVITIMMLVWARLPYEAPVAETGAEPASTAGRRVASVVRAHLRHALQAALTTGSPVSSSSLEESTTEESPLSNEVRLLAVQMEAMLDGSGDCVT